MVSSGMTALVVVHHGREPVAVIRQVGDPWAAPSSSALSASLQDAGRGWFGLRGSVITPGYRAKYREGAAGFYVTDQVFPGL